MTSGTHHDHLLSAVQEFWTQYKRVHERRQLRDRPWLEDVLHWSADGDLHGHLAPASPGPRSVTSDGWCPGQAWGRAASTAGADGTAC